MSDKYFLDTNILVYAHDVSTPEKQKIAKDLIYEGIIRDQAVISSQVLSEFYVTVTRKIANPLSDEFAREEIRLLTSICRVDIDGTLVLRGLEIRSRWQTSYWDALIIAAAVRAGCSTLYSEDLSHGQKIENILITNPFL